MSGFGVPLETTSMIGAITWTATAQMQYATLLFERLLEVDMVDLLCVFHVGCGFGPHGRNRQLQVAPLTHFDDHWTS